MSTGTRTKGEFVIEFEPLPADDDVMSRMRVTRAYTGGLAGRGVAQMLSAGTPIEGSTASVALERVVGTLDGRQGSFMFQHTHTMWRGLSNSISAIIPDSGTGDLWGLRGHLMTENRDTHHTYVLEYVIITE